MIKDSGERKQFDTGAVRDIQEGKGRCDLLPLFEVAEILGDPLIGCIAMFMKTGDPKRLQQVFCEFTNMYFTDEFSAMLDVAKHYEEGAKKYGERNWEKGIPLHCYIDSAIRHYLKFRRDDNDEPHDRAFLWNILGALWTLNNMPELNDINTDNSNKKK